MYKLPEHFDHDNDIVYSQIDRADEMQHGRKWLRGKKRHRIDAWMDEEIIKYETLED